MYSNETNNSITEQTDITWQWLLW